jgi:hypothetical protein
MGILLFAAGCGSSGGSGGSGGTGATGGTGGTGGTGTTTSMGGTGGSGGSTTTGSAMLLPPIMQSAEPLEGGLHVMWMNQTMDCDKIELSRKKDAGMYAVAYTLAGAATSQHDAQATAPGTYCYKARCLKGMDASADSNEKCGTP